MELKDLFFASDGLRLHYIEGPQAGPSLVLLHGATGSVKAWDNIIPPLTDKWHVYALDLRGQGLSGHAHAVGKYHIDYFVQDVVSFLRNIVKERAVLLGHSYGAITALLAGLPGKDFCRALVLEDPPLGLRRPEEQPANPYQDYFTWVYQMRQADFTLDQMLDAMAERNPGAPREAFLPWAQNIAWLDPAFVLSLIIGDRRQAMAGVDYQQRIQGIACPVLMLQADPVKGAALTDVDLDFFLSNCPQTKVVKFPGAGHGIHDEQTEAFLKAFNEFTASI